MDEMSIIDAIQAWFIKKTGVPMAVDVEYMTSGDIDSFDTLDLITYVETIFHIRFDADDFQRDDFSNLRGMATLIKCKME